MLNPHYGQAFNALTGTEDAKRKTNDRGRSRTGERHGGGWNNQTWRLHHHLLHARLRHEGHPTGQVIGIALGFFSGTSSSDQGSVLVLVNPSYYGGPTGANYLQNGGSATLTGLTVNGSVDLAGLNVSGTTTMNDLTVQTIAVSGNLTVTGVTTVTDITINGHIITGGDAPTITVQTSAGTGATCAVTGDDTAGKLTLTTGTTGWTAGVQCALTFNTAYPSVPNVTLTRTGTTNDESVVPTLDPSKTGFTINFIFPDTGQHTYTWDFTNLD